MSFLSRPSPSSSSMTPADIETRKLQVMTEVRSQLALANAQELINKLNEKCFEKCIKPSSAAGLTSSDEKCLTMCSDRFLEAFNIVSRSYVSRIGRERETASIGTLGGGMGGDNLM